MSPAKRIGICGHMTSLVFRPSFRIRQGKSFGANYVARHNEVHLTARDISGAVVPTTMNERDPADRNHLVTIGHNLKAPRAALFSLNHKSASEGDVQIQALNLK